MITFCLFPGLTLENYIHKDLGNVSLTVLEGEVMYETAGQPSKLIDEGTSVRVAPANFHKIHTTSKTPSCYMYTYYNTSDAAEAPTEEHKTKSFGSEYIQRAIDRKIDNFLRSVALLSNSFLRILFNAPMIRRIKVYE